MTPARVIALVQALAGVDWSSMSANPALTVESVAEAVLPCFGPAGLVAADAVALFVALNRLGVIRPGASGEGQTRDTPHSGRRA